MKMTTRWMALVIAVATGAATASRAARADTTFDTTPFFDGVTGIQPYGNPNTSTYGETFIAPTDNVLQSFTFYIQNNPGVDLHMTADVFAWSGSLLGGNGPQGATGPVLFNSSSFEFVSSGDSSFSPVTVSTGGTTLTAGSNYVILFTISHAADYAASIGTTYFGLISGQHVANDGGGGFNFYNNGSDFGALNTSNWDDFLDFGDLAFKANFTASSVPEPASLTLCGIACAAVLCGRMRRKKSAA